MKQFVLARCFAGMAAALLLGMLLVDCGNTPDSVGGSGQISGGGGGGGTVLISLPDASASGSAGNGGGASPTPDANCGSKTYGASKSPTDVLLVLDRSGSMNESIAEDCCCDDACAQSTGVGKCSDTSNCTKRWPALTSAVSATITTTTEINWGLKLFSSVSSQGGNSCTVSTAIEVTVDRPATDIQTAIANTSPGASTPTAKALSVATDYLKTVKDTNNKVILLATDGEPNCGANAKNASQSDVSGTTAAVTAAVTAGFKVYVIGIGPATDYLQQFATSGQTDHYYPATSAADLAQALADISTAVSSCTFTIDPTAATQAGGSIAVYLNNNLVPNDPSNGWSFGASDQTVVLNGTTCDAVKTGKSSQVQILLPCGTPPPVLR